MSSWPLSPQAAAEELLARRAARNSLIDFTVYTKPDFDPADHHRLIASKLEAVERGEIKRLMVFMPPRHGKSELCSRRFPAWFMGRNPGKQIICSTYAQQFADDFGREVRNIIREPEYQNIYDVSVRADSSAAGRWHTSEGGVFFAAGAGGAITGRGADIALIDDPVKNSDDADSERKRESIWHWYSSTLRTRLMPGGAIVVIMTRWHEDDLAGRLLEKMSNGGEQWDILSLPAINEQGKALWPKWYDLESLNQIKSTILPRYWFALYQQEPTTDEGDLFKRDWFSRYNPGEQPSNTHKYLSSDFGVTKDGGDYTEFGIFDVDADSNIYITDWWYGQETSDIWAKKKISMCKEHSVLTAFGETGVIRRAVEPLINAECKDQNHYPHIEWITRTGDKVAMSRVFQGLCSQGKVYIPNTEWGDRLINQLTKFPNAKNDDAVDVCTLFGLALDSIIGATRPPLESERVRDYYEDDDEGLDNWKTA